MCKITNPSSGDRKNSVSDKVFAEKAPIILDLLLQGGQYQTVGASQIELEKAAQKSPDTVHRITRRLSGMGILKVKRRGGGNPSYYSIIRGKEPVARELCEHLRKGGL